MRKIETIWHHVLNEALVNKKFQHTQQDIARAFHYSLSTIHHALSIPTQIGAIRKTSKFFVLQDFKKLLYYWASVRTLSRNILYKTYSDLPVRDIEGFAIPESIFGAYSAAKHLLSEPVADYSKVYFYIQPDHLEKFQARFPPSPKKLQANTHALKMTPVMTQYGSVTTLTQTFVDIWNLSDWYARDFSQALEEKIYALLS